LVEGTEEELHLNAKMVIARRILLFHTELMVATAKAVIQNEAGIHCRPSAHIIKNVANYSGDMRVVHPGEGESDLRSMLSLMMLGLTCGSEVNIEVKGPDEKGQAARLVELFETHYDFPQKD